MVNKHRKRLHINLSSGKCRYKSHNSIYHKIIKMANMKRLTAPNVEDVEQSHFSYIAGGRAKWYNQFENCSIRFYVESTPTLRPRDSTSMYLTEMNTYVHRKMGTIMSIAIFFIIAPNCKQPQSPSAAEWINKL